MSTRLGKLEAEQETQKGPRHGVISREIIQQKYEAAVLTRGLPQQSFCTALPQVQPNPDQADVLILKDHCIGSLGMGPGTCP